MKLHVTSRARVAATLAAVCLFLPGAAARTWTDHNGRAFEGDLARVEEAIAVIVVQGSEFHFPLAHLSVADRLFAVRSGRPASPTAAAVPVPTVPPTPDPAREQVAALAAAKSSADIAFNAYNAAFLVRAGGKTYYRKNTASPASNGTWVLALEIQLAEDVYERTRSGAHRQLVMDLLTSFLAKEGTDWSYDSWNDDIGWMMLALIRGYQITPNPVLLNTVVSQWKMTYDRGWDDTFGGGIWEDNKPKFSKCALSNDPMIIVGCALYQITHDAKYLARCKEIYAWVHDNLFDQVTGQVSEGIARDGKQVSDNVYNSGSFIIAANCLHKITGDDRYLKDAMLAADHVVGKHLVLSHNAREDNCWADQFARGLGDLCRDNNLWGRYRSWIGANARSAWSFRRTDLDVTWNDWKKTTPKDNCSSFECLGAVVLQQIIPPPQ